MELLLRPGAQSLRGPSRSARQQQLAPCSSAAAPARRGRGAGCSSSVCYYASGRAPESSVFAVTPVGVVEKAEEMLLPLPTRVESAADDPQLHNPLVRAQRLSTSWFGVILELEGVLIQGSEEEHIKAWLQVAEEYGYKRPIGQQLRRMKGVRDEVIVSRVFGWTHNPVVGRQVAQRKAEIYEQLLNGRQPVAMLEARPFLETLKRNSIPVAVVSPLTESKVEDLLQRFNLRPFFDAVVTADDAGSAEIELYYAYAAQRMQRPPLRCVVLGESNNSVEAAIELGMKSIVVTGSKPVYDFGSADLIVRNLSQINFMNLRKLFGAEELTEPRLTLEDLEAANSGMTDNGYDVPEDSGSHSLAASHSGSRGQGSGVGALGGRAEEDDPFGFFDDDDDDDFLDEEDDSFGSGRSGLGRRSDSPARGGLHGSLAYQQ